MPDSRDSSRLESAVVSWVVAYANRWRFNLLDKNLPKQDHPPAEGRRYVPRRLSYPLDNVVVELVAALAVAYSCRICLVLDIRLLFPALHLSRVCTAAQVLMYRSMGAITLTCVQAKACHVFEKDSEVVRAEHMPTDYVAETAAWRELVEM